MNSKFKYCLDAGALIVAHRHVYPFDMFGSWWSWIERVIAYGAVFACEETFLEIERGDFLYWWAQLEKRKDSGFVRKTEAAEIEKYERIIASYPHLGETGAPLSMADTYIIAHAWETETIVVTEEKRTNSPQPRKIPDVCDRLGIPCLNLLTFMRREGASF